MTDASCIMPARWCEISVPLRVAVGATLVERVLPLRSPSFIRHYHQDEALEHAWRFAQGRDVAIGERNRIREAVRPLLIEKTGESEFESENGQRRTVSFYEVSLAMFLLEEIDESNGTGVSAAVDAAAFTFAQVLLDGRNVEYSPELCDELGLPIYEAAKEMYAQALRLPLDVAIRRDMFSLVHIRQPDVDGVLRKLRPWRYENSTSRR